MATRHWYHDKVRKWFERSLSKTATAKPQPHSFAMEQHTDLSIRDRKMLYENQLNGNNIRLLEILPGEVEASLQCRLVEVSLATAPAYEALSYVWGDPGITESILCNDFEVKITVNLAQALRRLRRRPNTSEIDAQNEIVRSAHSSKLLPTYGIRVLWADALCINQQDSIEKGHQVQLMKEVYSRAAHVMVWLGPGDPEVAATAVAAIELVNLAVGRPIEPGKLSFESMETLMSEQGFQDPWVALMDHLFASPWFQRIWCVQEVLLAQDVTLIFGNADIHVSEFGSFCEWYDDELNRSPQYLELRNANNILQAESLFTVFRKNLAHWRKKPSTILNAYRYLEATDMRDKFYGLLGLMEDSPYEVDYNKSVAEVYTDSVVHSINMEGNLRCLSHVQHGHKYEYDTEFPSWVPRWDIYSPNTRIGTFHLLAGCTIGPVPAQDPTQRTILQTNGILHDEVLVARYVDPATDHLAFQQSIQKHKSFLSSLLREVQDEHLKSTLTLFTLAATLTTGSLSAEHEISSRLTPTEVNSDLGKQFLADFLSFFQSLFHDEVITSPMDLPDGSSERYAKLTLVRCNFKRLFRTAGGYFGLGPGCMMEGDIVVLLDGGMVPYILRPIRGSSSEFYFMGECYIYDIMYEKGAELLRQAVGELKTFRLV